MARYKFEQIAINSTERKNPLRLTALHILVWNISIQIVCKLLGLVPKLRLSEKNL